MGSRVAIVGAGVSGLAAAHRMVEDARAWNLDCDVVVFEAQTAPGGHASTRRDGEFLVERGPNGFLHRPGESQTLDLARELGIDDRVIDARAEAARRFIVRERKLTPVPDSPRALVASAALSLRGKLRLLLEPFASRPLAGKEETVYEFARRRIGKEGAEMLVDTAVAGISAGDSRALSVAAAFPKMVAMEREHGSLIRAMIASRRTSSRPTLKGFDGGMGTLVDALARALGERLRSATAVTRIEHNTGATQRAWTLHTAGEAVAADAVLLALPAPAAARITESLDAELSETLATIQPAAIDVVALAFASEDIPERFDGYGYLVTKAENMATLGVLKESSIFDGRTDSRHVLLRIMLGGARRPEVAALDEKALVERARLELGSVLGVHAKPLKTWVTRWEKGIPQYTLGHLQRVATARHRTAHYPRLALCGSSYDGVAFDAAVSSGRDRARELLRDVAGDAHLQPSRPGPPPGQAEHAVRAAS